ncbi:deaminase [Streptomyces sp. NPDC057854]|uniref:deaminase n=1 Tax=unclassified Streptomyces TaxID=2593676 RepID=UPI0036C11B71
MRPRPDRDAWHLRGAAWLAEMGDCTRRRVGAVIVGPDKRFWGMGYNGARPGGPSCLAGDCPRGRHYKETATVREWHADGDGWRDVVKERCAGDWNPWPCPDAVAPGSSYDTGPGACIASHAEANAVADAMQRGGGRLGGAVMYVSCEPCEGCVRHVRNTTDIKAIIWPKGTVTLP